MQQAVHTNPADYRKICTGCGTVNEATSTFCLNCGLSLPSAALLREQAPGNPGGFWVRVAAFLIDGILLYAVTLLLAALVGFDFGAYFESTGLSLFDFAAIAVDVAYATLTVGTWGRTLGKWVVGLHVVNADGSRLTYGRSLARAISIYLSVFAFGLGILSIALSTRKRGWHDFIAGSQVVRTRSR